MQPIFIRSVILTSLAAIWCSAGSAFGATYTVLNTNDSGAGSLRAGILNANAGGGGELVFAPSVAGTISLSTDLPSLTANVTITGPGANLLTISGADECRVFSINPDTTNKLSGLTIADGWSAGGWPSLTFASGISNGGSLKLADCVITNCHCYFSYGKGIFNTGTLEMERCLVADCYDIPVPDPFTRSPGGGVYNAGTLTMTNCTISNCGTPAGSGGGGIYNSGELLMCASAVVDCDAGHEGDGGGISTSGETTLISCVVSNCSGWDGGGILNWSGTLCMTNCSVLDNDAVSGAGILSFSGNAVLNGCTVAGNFGGVVGGSVDNLGAMELYNCTVSGNTMEFYVSPSKGSGISSGATEHAVGAISLYLDHCTVVSNGGPVQVWTVNTITSDYSILSNCVGTLDSSAGHNLIMSTDGCVLTNNTAGNLYNVDPLLGPLQNNGGPTMTHALLIGSPAINAAGAADPTPTDQRGVSRPQGPASDIGEFEFSYTLPALVRMTKQPFANPCLQLSGLPGSACTVQASTNCHNWANVTNLVLCANGIIEFIDADAPKYPSRFYRLTMPVPPGWP